MSVAPCAALNSSALSAFVALSEGHPVQPATCTTAPLRRFALWIHPLLHRRSSLLTLIPESAPPPHCVEFFSCPAIRLLPYIFWNRVCCSTHSLTYLRCNPLSLDISPVLLVMEDNMLCAAEPHRLCSAHQRLVGSDTFDIVVYLFNLLTLTVVL